MTDILLYESGNGGEVSIKNGDLETTDGIFNMIYLAHFGGNLKASTLGNEEEGEERFDWWGNTFLEQSAQMNSELERTLQSITLNSAGRVKVERAAKKDLEFLTIGDVITTATILGNNIVQISHKIKQTTVSFIWDATKQEIIEEKII